MIGDLDRSVVLKLGILSGILTNGELLAGECLEATCSLTYLCADVPKVHWLIADSISSGSCFEPVPIEHNSGDERRRYRRPSNACGNAFQLIPSALVLSTYQAW